MNMARADIVAGSQQPYSDAKSLIEFAKANPGKWSFPSALAAAIALLSALLGWNGWRRRHRKEEALPKPGEDDEKVASRPYIIAAIVVMALYIVGMPLFGYLLATAAALLALSAIYGNRRPLGLVIVAAVAPPALYFFFQEVMIILLPEASLF
jgi:hypothetical protein